MKNRKIVCILLLTLSQPLLAQDLWDSLKKETQKAIDGTEKAYDKVMQQGDEQDGEVETQEQGGRVTEPVKPARKKKATSAVEDKPFEIGANLSPFNFPFPMGWGVHANYATSPQWEFGVDYLNSSKALKVFSLEIGAIDEQSYALQAKRYIGKSFNLRMGVGQRHTEVRFAKNLYDLATKTYSETASRMESNFIRLGLGNRWRFKQHYRLNVDWLTLDIPFSGKVTKSASRFADTPEDQEDIEDAESILKYYPNAAILKFEVGFEF